MLNKDILIHLYNELTSYDHALIGKIRQTCRLFSYYPKGVLSVERETTGTHYYLLVNGKKIRHRSHRMNPLTDGPAIEWSNGDKEWFVHGERHREDGPARECVGGHREWWVHNKQHREDGPAIEHLNGRREWFVHGKRHREGGPAFECVDGHKEWWVHGEQHREDGPAIEWANGNKSWWLYGKEYNERDFETALKKLSY